MAPADPTGPSHPPQYWSELSEAAEKSGDYLSASDAALLGLEAHPSDSELQYRAILNLSRSGAKNRAMQLWRQYGLEARLTGNDLAPGLRTDIAALGARLDRELAYDAPPLERPERLRQAAARYESIYRRTQQTFPGINAAVHYELGHDSERAQAIAARIVEQCDAAAPKSDEERYQLAADRASAYLLLDEVGSARAAIAEAAHFAQKASSIASTRKQLQKICEAKNIDDSILAALKNHTVVHYTGDHLFLRPPAAWLGCAEQARIAAEIRDQLVAHDVGFAYGSLNAGAEILTVETLLAGSSEVNVVLPFRTASFRQAALGGAEGEWLARFDRCLSQIAAASEATDAEYAEDLEVFTYTSRLAMGMARLRAENLSADVIQIAVCDARDARDPAARSHVVQEWQNLGLPTILVPSGAAPGLRDAASAPAPARPMRVRAIMFGDFAGFSTLDDEQMLSFYAQVMPRVAAVLDRHDAAILTRNTWGDGLYLVLDDILEGARCALGIQASLAELDLAAHGLPPTLNLRLGLHAGAVYEVEDPILKALAFTGSHICRTARIEPGTPPSEVYVTEAFAALLALHPATGLGCEYVGKMKAAKNYGRFRTYLLRRL